MRARSFSSWLVVLTLLSVACAAGTAGAASSAELTSEQSSVAVPADGTTAVQPDMDETKVEEGIPAFDFGLQEAVVDPLRFIDSARRPETELRAAVDGDPETDLVLIPGSTFEIDFVGAQRWIDRVEITASGGPIEVLVRDWHHEEIPVGTTDPASRAPAEFFLDPLQAEGIILRVPGDSTPAWVSGVSGTFDIRDPDDFGGELPRGGGTRDSYREVLIEWINNYPGSSSDRTIGDDERNGLWNALPSSWYKYSYGNHSVWEDDFKRSGSGGQEYKYIDKRDLVYFSGHGTLKWDWYFGGSKRSIYVENKYHDDRYVVPGEARDAWGDGDMEWIGLSCCSLLAHDPQWARALDGLHLICGWKTHSHQSNRAKKWGQYMVSSGSYDPAWKVKQAWFQMSDDTHSPGHVTRVIGENSNMGKDYIWGQGTVQSDPPVNNYYYKWTHTTTKGRSSEGEGREGERHVFPGERPVRAPSPSSVRVPARTPRGYKIIYDPDLLTRSRDLMPRFEVEHEIVDESYVQQIADELCAEHGRMCTGDIGPDEDGNLWMVDGPDRLCVSLETGAATLMNAETWLAERMEDAAIPPTAWDAYDEAEAFLFSIGQSAGNLWEVSYLHGEEVERESGVIEDDVVCNVQVDFIMEGASGQFFVGPGSRSSVTIGDGYQIERWSEGGNRQFFAWEYVDILDFTDVVDILATHGCDGTIDGIGVPVDSMYVNSYATGWYMHDRWTHQDYADPTYIFDVDVYFDNEDDPAPDPTPLTFCVNGYRWPPLGSIDAPSTGGWYDEGTPITFQGSATGGTPPYTLYWSSDIDGDLGIGGSITTPLSVAYVDSVVVPQAVSLRVTDSEGMTTTTSIEVGINSLTEYATHNVGEVALTVTNQGILGFTDDSGATGSGFVYGGENMLFIGSPWLGNSPTYVANREYSAEPDQDWVVSSDPEGYLLFGDTLYSDQDGFAIFDDSGHPSPRGILVEQRSWAFMVRDPAIAEQRGIILFYSMDVPTPANEHFGLFMDFDMGTAAQNEGEVNELEGYASMWFDTGPYAGVSLIDPIVPVNMSMVHNPTYVYPLAYMTDEDKYLFLSGGDPAHTVLTTDAPDDWSVIVSATPPVIPPPAGRATNMQAVFGIAVGDTPEELSANLAALKTFYQELYSPDTGIDGLEFPHESRLAGAMPNPCADGTSIRYSLATPGRVELRIYDVSGRLVRTLVDDEREAGWHFVPWDGRDSSGKDVASGVYFVMLHAGGETSRDKVVVVR